MIKNYKIAVISLFIMSLSISSLLSAETQESQEINFPEGYTNITEDLYEKDKFPYGIPYNAEELVLLPSGDYDNKFYIGELEVLEKINDNLYMVKPYISRIKRFKNWRDNFFAYKSGYSDPVCYLFIPYKVPDIIGKYLFSDNSNQISIYSIENMTDEDKEIKDVEKRKNVPEFTMFFKYNGYLNVDDKEYPYQEKPETAEKSVPPSSLDEEEKNSSDKDGSFFSFLNFFGSSSPDEEKKLQDTGKNQQTEN